jgi:hypothetical protein
MSSAYDFSTTIPRRVRRPGSGSAGKPRERADRAFEAIESVVLVGNDPFKRLVTNARLV